MQPGGVDDPWQVGNAGLARHDRPGDPKCGFRYRMVGPRQERADQFLQAVVIAAVKVLPGHPAPGAAVRGDDRQPGIGASEISRQHPGHRASSATRYLKINTPKMSSVRPADIRHQLHTACNTKNCR